ncbi:MAG: tetratricopeptide repeat protein [Anaerolineae bacterium]|nr:tetratricopeptide repeat protein [Anaerolineae bacterium]
MTSLKSLKSLGIPIRIALLLILVLLLPEANNGKVAALVGAGDQAQSSGHYAEAIDHYQRALAIMPDTPALLEKLITSSSAAHRTDLALIYLDLLTSKAGWTSSRYRLAATLHAEQGEPEAALVYWRSSLNGTHADQEAIRRLTEAALTRRQWEIALRYLDRWLKIDPRDEWALFNAGLLYAPRDLALTQRYLTQAGADPQYKGVADAIIATFVQYASDDASTLALRVGLQMLNHELWSQAEYAFNISLANNPNNPAALAFLGIARDQQGLDGESLLVRALTLAPNDPQLLYAAAVHYRIKGDLAQALNILEQLGTQNPTNAAIAAEIGNVYRSFGDLVETLEWYKVAVGLAPEDQQFAVLLATLYADEDINLKDEGVLVIGRLAEKFSSDPNIIACYAWALYRTDKPQDARAQLERALALDTTNSRARYFYALVMEARGDVNTAISSLLYVYQNAREQRFRDLAVRALDRMGYKPTFEDLMGKVR